VKPERDVRMATHSFRKKDCEAHCERMRKNPLRQRSDLNVTKPQNDKWLLLILCLNLNNTTLLYLCTADRQANCSRNNRFAGKNRSYY
jgi:hypothetical protein